MHPTRLMSAFRRIVWKCNTTWLADDYGDHGQGDDNDDDDHGEEPKDKAKDKARVRARGGKLNPVPFRTRRAGRDSLQPGELVK